MIPVAPVEPVLPFLDLDQLKDLVKVLPSTVTGILNEPLSAKLVPVFAWIVMIAPFLLKVKPFTVGKVPIVGVILEAPL